MKPRVRADENLSGQDVVRNIASSLAESHNETRNMITDEIQILWNEMRAGQQIMAGVDSKLINRMLESHDRSEKRMEVFEKGQKIIRQRMTVLGKDLNKLLQIVSKDKK